MNDPVDQSPLLYAGITRRTIFALGLITLRPSTTPSELTFDEMRVLGYVRINEETKNIPILPEGGQR